MTIQYEIGDSLYLNITNKCPCNCEFCIRKNGDNAYGSEPLWLEHEPSLEEIYEALDKVNLNKYKEIVFCGFGEPLERLDTLTEVCKYLHKRNSPPIRVNTNGLSDLINEKPTAHLLENLVDIISISLNAGTEQEYLRVTNPKFKQNAFKAVQDFAVDCKAYIPKVIFTVVDVIPTSEINLAQKIADKLQIPLRVRKYDC